jgi:hypothetical protein
LIREWHPKGISLYEFVSESTKNGFISVEAKDRSPSS